MNLVKGNAYRLIGCENFIRHNTHDFYDTLLCWVFWIFKKYIYLLLIFLKPQTGCFGNSLFEFPEVTASSKSGTEAFPVSGGYGLVGRGHTVLCLPDSVSDTETPGRELRGGQDQICPASPNEVSLSCPAGQCHGAGRGRRPAGTEKSARLSVDPTPC